MTFPPPNRRQAHLFWAACTGLSIAVLVGLVVLLVWGLSRVLDILSPVLWPLAAAGVIAYLLDPVVDWFERRRISRSRSIVIVFAIALVIVATVLVNIVPPIVNQTRQFGKRIPEIREKVQSWIEKWAENPPAWSVKLLQSAAPPTEVAPPPDANTAPDLSSTNAPVATANPTAGPLSSALSKSTIESVTGWVAGFLPRARSWVASWFAVLVGIALVPIYAFYLLLEKRGIQSKWTNYLPVKDSAFKDELVFVLQSINDYLIAFFRGQVLVAICDGILYCIGFLIIGLPYAILLGAAAVVLTIVPFIGAMILFVTSMVIALAQFGDWKHFLFVIIVFAIVQSLEGTVISPRIMKGRVGLHPLAIIIAVMIGTTLLGGLLGGVLAIPLAAVLRVVMARYIWKRPLPKSSL